MPHEDCTLAVAGIGGLVSPSLSSYKDAVTGVRVVLLLVL